MRRAGGQCVGGIKKRVGAVCVPASVKGQDGLFLARRPDPMKRQLPASDEKDALRQQAPSGRSTSPVGKQHRADEPEPSAPWDAHRDVAVIAALCDRLGGATADLADLYEATRLTQGAMGGGTARARLSTADEPECAVPLRAYSALWRTLAADPGAVAAARRHAAGWPPTFVDVQRAYAALEPESAFEHARQLDLEAVDDPVAAAADLALAVGAAARRAAKVARLVPSDFAGSVEPFPAAWYDVLDATGSAFVGGCDPGVSYYVMAVQNDAYDRVVLFRVGDDGGATAVAIAATPTGRSLLDPGAAEMVRLDGAPALEPHSVVLPSFLHALVYDAIDTSRRIQEARESDDAEALSRLSRTADLFEPLPAGAAQVRRALLPVPSRFAVPDAIYDYIARSGPNAIDIWLDGEISGAWLDECRLVLALRLFAGQLEARATGGLLPRKPLSLANAAAAAYQGPLRRGMMPEEALDRASVYAWQGACAAPASASGLLPGAARLLDVAHLWGHAASAAEASRPELLCVPLADLARARIPDIVGGMARV